MKLKINNSARDIRDDEIRILGSAQLPWKKTSPKWLYVAILSAVVLMLVLLADFVFGGRHSAEDIPFEEPVQGLYEEQDIAKIAEVEKSYMDVETITLSGVPMRIYTPVNAEPHILLGPQDFNNSDIVFIAQAADVRADNMEILGEFVLNGEKKARGRSKLGWCSLINGEIRLGCSAEPQEFTEAQERGGSFFRQYGLVADGKYVKDSNSKKYEAIRRAICTKGDEVFVIETLEPMSLLLFAYAIEEFGVDNAVMLVGGTAYGFAVNESGEKIEFGDVEKNLILDSTSYLVWK